MGKALKKAAFDGEIDRCAKILEKKSSIEAIAFAESMADVWRGYALNRLQTVVIGRHEDIQSHYRDLVLESANNVIRSFKEDLMVRVCECCKDNIKREDEKRYLDMMYSAYQSGLVGQNDGSN